MLTKNEIISVSVQKVWVVICAYTDINLGLRQKKVIE